MRASRLWRYSAWDGVLVALALVHGAALAAAPSVMLVAAGMWWNANTISHHFVHLPFFRSRRMNVLFSVYLSLLLGFPQHLWRARHLAHHAGGSVRTSRWSPDMTIELGLIAGLWAVLAATAPVAFITVYLPGWALGLALCALQGFFEHARGTTSHYGRVYNVLFFNDGFHVEHHARPSLHWTRLGRQPRRDPRASRWPAVLRWLDHVPAALDALERLALRSPALQRFLIGRHEAAMAACWASRPAPRSVAIIGGGLFPRTAIVCRRLFPHARLTVIDRSPSHLEIARRFGAGDVTTMRGDADAIAHFDADLVVVPLALVGERERFYARPPAAAVLVHDWIWRRRGQGRVVSWWLLKRVNLVQQRSGAAAYASRTA